MIVLVGDHRVPAGWLGMKEWDGDRRSGDGVILVHDVVERSAEFQLDDPADVVMAAEAELTALLNLQSCRFEAPPFTSTFERFERSGFVTGQNIVVDGGFSAVTI